jgi:hypothetical protein
MSASAVALGWLLPLPTTAEIAPDTPTAISSGIPMIAPSAATPTFAIIVASPPAGVRPA